MKENTFIICSIRTDLVEKCIETIYKYNKPDSFYIYFIDNTKDGIYDKVKGKIHLYFRANRNLGFSKSNNTAIRCVQTPYFTLINDDVELINSKWWQGILDTFDMVDKATPHKPCALATPSSIKLPDWSVGKPKGEHHYMIPYKENYTEEDWDSLISKPHYVNKHFTIQPGSVVDGVTMYCSVLKAEHFRRVGYLDERFNYGGGEDYDWSCRANMAGFRVVGTSLSYLYHHWSKSLESIKDYKELIDEDRVWNNNNEKWGDNFDIWGRRCSICKEHMKIIKGTDYATCSKSHEKYKIPNITIEDF